MYEHGKVSSDKRLSIGLITQHYRGEINNTNLINSNSSGASSNLFNDSEQSLPQPTAGTPGGISVKAAPSLSSLNTNSEAVSVGAQLNIYNHLIDAAHKSIPKKKIESQVRDVCESFLAENNCSFEDSIQIIDHRLAVHFTQSY